MTISLKIEARVFANPDAPSGGNPVTVFLFSLTDKGMTITTNQNEPPFDTILRSELAQTCPWESVMTYIFNDTSDYDTSLPELFFYMPSGEEVPFCAHAAMGACAVIAHQRGIRDGHIKFIRGMNFSMIREDSVFVNESLVQLSMENNLEELDVDHTIVGQLLDQVGLTLSDVLDDRSFYPAPCLPCIVNSSVARHKTLVPLKSVGKLHKANNPRDPNLFRVLCDSIQSTGIYLYSPCKSVIASSTPSYECRQFPRGSGYPEDPATGIAASALASSLFKRKLGDDYVFLQGTAMGRPSKIAVNIIPSSPSSPTKSIICCSGFVTFDTFKNM